MTRAGAQGRGAPRRWPALLTSAAIAALLVACGGGDGGERAAPTTATAAPSSPSPTTTRPPKADCSPGRTEARTDAALTFEHGGLARSYFLALPPGDDGTTAHPVIFDFHGHGGNKEYERIATRLAVRGPAEGYVVVTPDATGEVKAWNMFGAEDKADDVGFVHALLADLEERLCIDPDRVFAAGHSNGSAFTAFLGCQPPLPFAAVAMVSATTPAGCPARGGPSVLAIAGTGDKTVPYDGGSVSKGPVGIPAAPSTAAWYAKKYACDPEPVRTGRGPGVERLTYSGCVDGIVVALDTVDGGTHPWPGSVSAKADPADSAAGKAYDATGAILEFFDAHPRTPAGG